MCFGHELYAALVLYGHVLNTPRMVARPVRGSGVGQEARARRQASHLPSAAAVVCEELTTVAAFWQDRALIMVAAFWRTYICIYTQMCVYIYIYI